MLLNFVRSRLSSSHSGESTAPGQMVTTLIPSYLSSNRMDLTKPMMPTFALQALAMVS